MRTCWRIQNQDEGESNASKIRSKKGSNTVTGTIENRIRLIRESSNT